MNAVFPRESFCRTGWTGSNPPSRNQWVRPILTGVWEWIRGRLRNHAKVSPKYGNTLRLKEVHTYSKWNQNTTKNRTKCMFVPETLETASAWTFHGIGSSHCHSFALYCWISHLTPQISVPSSVEWGLDDFLLLFQDPMCIFQIGSPQKNFWIRMCGMRILSCKLLPTILPDFNSLTFH